MIIESVLLSSCVFVSLLTCVIYRSSRSRDYKFLQLVQINQATGTLTYTYQELQEATDGFKEELGRGAFGAVYKGVLGSKDTNFVAVKMLMAWTGESEKEFERELVESDEEASRDIKMVKRFVMIALWCIQEDPALRPTMKKTTQMLEGVVEVPVPPVPSFFTTSI
ncbi:G-type lectin S-receptor-like serine/threonine-protein kinase LECRK1 [Eucalyptus grandis]|uniref:G-type lectin S-receptor-like serine/threonine-protein kinase LECRK1 n=1 Tax=Eucalyptus grandis TaxID=71139 RepID=UPI00192EB759|nr:G-type lectin S-receptor-like serine/threonine-protein kinase LECRK1 [Eucalyptus grandis]